MPGVRYKLISGMFKAIGVNRMLDKRGAELEKLMASYMKKQDNIKAPAEKISRDYDFEKKVIGGYDCYVTKQKGCAPQKALLYIFGGGYILPCDPGDFVLAGQFADHTGREVWFPIYPLAPRYKTVDAVKCVLAVYKKMLEILNLLFAPGSSFAKKPALWLNSHGISALAIGVYATKETPADQSQIPIEYITKACAWLKQRGYQKI